MDGRVLIDMKRAGFTLVEICVALVILAVAVLGISASAGQLASLSAGAESRALALQSVNDRLSLVQLSQNYAALDSVFTKTESNMPTTGMTRVTDLVRTQTAMPGGQFIDYTTITVTVSGPRVTPPISRSLIVGAP
jgi:prepilin-type N-terminal cleavage/methylation domain-containing protein